MKNIKKVFSTIAITGVAAIGLATVGAAANYGSYDTTVPILNDYESTPISKITTGSAYNKVSSKGTGKLVSWVESDKGSNLTTKVSYESTGTKTMDYLNASTLKGQKLHLNISTSTGTVHSVYTKGTWTPN